MIKQKKLQVNYKDTIWVQIGFNDDNNIIILADKQLPSKLKLFGVYWNIECKAKLERAFRLDSSPIIPNYNVYEIISMSIDSDIGLKINQIDNYIDKLVGDKIRKIKKEV